MDYKVFYRKYRPCSFDELVGQENIKEILVNSIKTGRIAHAYIFTGPRGTGKTSTAKIFAKTLNCLEPVDGISCNKCKCCISCNESPDIIEIDAASNNGVEEIRTLRDSVKISPYNSKYKVYIIDEVHMLSNSAWNAFLKTLEEPPGHVIFILATTEINKIPETVMSRCQRFDFSRIPSKTMKKHLQNICNLENVDIDEAALDELIKLSNGCLRDALSYLDKVSKFGNKITYDIVQLNFGTLSKKTLEDLYNNIISNNKKEINKTIDYCLNIGLTPLNFINEFVEFLLNKLMDNNFTNYDDIIKTKELIFKLNKLTTNFNSIVNPYTIIKVELITINYFPGNNFVNISQNNENNFESQINTLEQKKNDSVENSKLHVNADKINNDTISDEKKDDTKIETNILNKKIDIDKLKSIRINNSFVNVSKEYKKEFIGLWKSFIDNLSLLENYNILGYIEGAIIEVVSKTNVLFSFKNDSEALLFNENVNLIEKNFNEINSKSYKFLGLSNQEWLKEKKDFIDNKDKVYQYIEEVIDDNIVETVKSFDLAENIFGEEIIEIR